MIRFSHIHHMACPPFSLKKKIRLPQKPNRTNFQPNGLVRDPNFWNIVPLEHEALLLINILRVHIILPKRRILELKIGNRCFGHVPRCRINIPSLPGCPQDIEIEMPSNPKGRISRALSSHFVWLILNYEDVLRKKIGEEHVSSPVVSLIVLHMFPWFRR